MLATWLSYDDLERLVRRQPDRAGGRAQRHLRPLRQHARAGGTTPRRRTSAIAPEDSSEPFRAAAEARQPQLDPSDPVTIFQGGGFVTRGPYERSGQ